MTAERPGQAGRKPFDGGQDVDPLTWFGAMIDHCYDYAVAAKKAGRPIVGILCEYTPRELILAAGAVPVCLCGGSAETIPPAEEDLPANLCPLIKSTYGYHVAAVQPVPGDGRPGRGRDHLRRQEEDVRADGRTPADARAGAAAEARRPRRARPTGWPRCASSRRDLEQRFGVTITDEQAARGHRR